MATKKTTTKTKATPRKTTAKKAAAPKTTTPTVETKAEVKTEAVKEVAPIVVEEAVREPKTFSAGDMIPCKSVVIGELIYTSPKSGLTYQWMEFGDTCEVEYNDLKILKLSRSAYIYNPWFMIEDEDLLNEWSDIKQVYKGYDFLDDPVEFFENLTSEELEDILSDCSAGLKDTLKNVACRLIRNGELDSIKVVNMFDLHLGTDLKLLLD